MIEINNSNFQDEVIKSKMPVVVEFWSDFCIQCFGLSPKLQKLENKYNNVIKFVSLNIKNNIFYDGQELTKQNEINCLPTCLISNKGKIQGKFIGNLPENEIEFTIKKVLNLK